MEWRRPELEWVSQSLSCVRHKGDERLRRSLRSFGPLLLFSLLLRQCFLSTWFSPSRVGYRWKFECSNGSKYESMTMPIFECRWFEFSIPTTTFCLGLHNRDTLSSMHSNSRSMGIGHGCYHA